MIENKLSSEGCHTSLANILATAIKLNTINIRNKGVDASIEYATVGTDGEVTPGKVTIKKRSDYGTDADDGTVLYECATDKRESTNKVNIGC